MHSFLHMGNPRDIMPSAEKEAFVSQAKIPPYYCQKPHKATALFRFVASIQKIFAPTKLRSTLKYKFWMQEKANPHDNADAYRGDLTHYCAKSSYFKEILPYQCSANAYGAFYGK